MKERGQTFCVLNLTRAMSLTPHIFRSSANKSPKSLDLLTLKSKRKERVRGQRESRTSSRGAGHGLEGGGAVARDWGLLTEWEGRRATLKDVEREYYQG